MQCNSLEIQTITPMVSVAHNRYRCSVENSPEDLEIEIEHTSGLAPGTPKTPMQHAGCKRHWWWRVNGGRWWEYGSSDRMEYQTKRSLVAFLELLLEAGLLRQM